MEVDQIEFSNGLSEADNNFILIINNPDNYEFKMDSVNLSEFKEIYNYLEEFTVDKEHYKIEFIYKENLDMKKLNIQNSYLIDKNKLTNVFQICGYRINKSTIFTDEIYKILDLIIKQQYKNDNEEYMNHISKKSCIVLKSKLFFTLSKVIIFKSLKSKVHLKRYFNVSYNIIVNKFPIVILIGGTSGTGKSTVSSILGDILGIKNVISTDHIRHIVRNFVSKEENPVIYASTYDAWKSVSIF